jgi:hypothetical protein
MTNNNDWRTVATPVDQDCKAALSEIVLLQFPDRSETPRCYTANNSGFEKAIERADRLPAEPPWSK